MQSGMTPDLLLLDLPLGDTDGLHILRWLRRLRPALPIILIGHPDDAGRNRKLFAWALGTILLGRSMTSDLKRSSGTIFSLWRLTRRISPAMMSSR